MGGVRETRWSYDGESDESFYARTERERRQLAEESSRKTRRQREEEHNDKIREASAWLRRNS